MKLLTPLQKTFLDSFFETSASRSFRLGAGTALSAFYLEHRESDDLDFFTTDESLSFDLVVAGVLALADKLNLTVTNQVTTPEYLQFFFKSGDKEDEVELKTEFIRELSPQYGEVAEFGKIRVDSLENIAVNKMLAVYGRFDAKDFVDLYFLVKEKGFDFDELMEKAKEKYVGFNEFYLAGNLADAGLLKDYPELLRPLDKNDLISFFVEIGHRIFEKLEPRGE